MSLHDRAILIDLTLTSLTTSRTDQGVTASVLRANAAKDDAGRWVSRLWTKEAIDPIARHDAKTGSLHREMTLSWLDNSLRILPTARFDEYMQVMRDRRPEREAIIRDHFIGRYAHWLQEAANMRQGLYRPAEYPDVATAAARFTFRVEAQPVPHRDDFRVSLSAGDMREMQAILDDRLVEAGKVARNDLVARISEPLVRIVERLSDPDCKFKDSLIDNIRTIAGAIPAFNVTDDPALEDVRLRIHRGLAQLDPDTLRESRSDRTRAAAEANQILASLAPWMEPLEAAA
jgi:hypothetical protein